MAVHTSEVIATEILRLSQKAAEGNKFLVVEKSYNGERVVFESNDQIAAQRVADQHPARRLVMNGQA